MSRTLIMLAAFSLSACSRESADQAGVHSRLDDIERRLNQITVEHNRHLCDEHAEQYECIRSTNFFCDSHGECPPFVVRREQVWP